MIRITQTATGIAAACALALAAAGPANAAPTTVKSQVERADSALERAMSLATQGRASAAIANVRKADRLTDAADRRARKGGSRSSRARDMRLVAAQFQENAEGAAKIVALVDGSPERAASAAVTQAVDGRQKALDTLAALAGRLPSAAQPGIARAIAAITNVGTRPATSLDRALRAGSVAPTSTDAVETAIAAVGDAAGRDADRLKALAERLPAAARRGIETAQERAAAGRQRGETRRGAAGACAAERDADAAAFDEKYRTNTADATEESNAYGMCVSGHSKATPPGSKGGAGRPEGAGPPAMTPGAAGPPAGIPAGPPA